MNQNNSKNIFHVTVDVNLMLENAIQRKKEILINVNANLKTNKTCMQKNMPWILPCVLVSVIKTEIDRYLKHCTCKKKYYWWFSIYMWWNHRHARDCVNWFYW